MEAEMQTQQVELSNHLHEALRKSEQRVQVINYILALLLIVTLVWAAYAYWRVAQQEKIESLALVPDSVKVHGSMALCPGDLFFISYVLDIEGTGVIVVDDSVRYGNSTVKFSTVRRDIIDDSTQRTYEDAWYIPDHPAMPIDGEFQWRPGLYTRVISVAASNAYVNRYTDPVWFQVPFLLREDCKYE